MTVMLLVIGLVGAFWPWIVAAVVVAVVYRWCVRSAERALERERARCRELAAIAARADEQNRLFIAGDPRGMYGVWPPA
jgi:hypothetical protein